MYVIISGYLEIIKNLKDVQNARHHTGMKERRKSNDIRRTNEKMEKNPQAT